MTKLRKLACIMFIIGCHSSTPSTESVPAFALGDVAVHAGYIGDVAIDPSSQKLSAHWSIQFIADSATLDSVVLLLNPALAISRVGGQKVAGYTSHPTDDAQVVTVRFARRLPLGTANRIDIDYAGVPAFGSDGINRIAPTWVELGLDSYWLPVFADYRKRIIGEVRIDLPAGWSAATSGNVTRSGSRLVLTTGIPLIDIAFTASPIFRQTDAASTTVLWVRPDSSTVARVLDEAESCRRYLNTRYGYSDSLAAVRLVLAPRSGPAYARRNYIVLTDVAWTPPPALGAYICHELSHFWSSTANSSGPENWLNEGFAEYVSSRYVRATFGQAQYDSVVARWQSMSAGQPPIWTPESRKRPSAQVAYRKAPFLLSRLEQRMGSEKMDQLLQRYMVERIRNTPDLIAAVADIAGAETAAWFRAELAR